MEQGAIGGGANIIANIIGAAIEPIDQAGFAETRRDRLIVVVLGRCGRHALGLGLLEERTVHGAGGKRIVGSRGSGENDRVDLSLCLIWFLDLDWILVRSDDRRQEAGREDERKQPERIRHGEYS